MAIQQTHLKSGPQILLRMGCRVTHLVYIEFQVWQNYINTISKKTKQKQTRFHWSHLSCPVPGRGTLHAEVRALKALATFVLQILFNLLPVIWEKIKGLWLGAGREDQWHGACRACAPHTPSNQSKNPSTVCIFSGSYSRWTRLIPLIKMYDSCCI